MTCKQLSDESDKKEKAEFKMIAPFRSTTDLIDIHPYVWLV
jgi:hypothetical protein